MYLFKILTTVSKEPVMGHLVFNYTYFNSNALTISQAKFGSKWPSDVREAFVFKYTDDDDRHRWMPSNDKSSHDPFG
jgi:hypothetical protein